MKWWAVRIVSGECRRSGRFACFVAAAHTERQKLGVSIAAAAIGMALTDSSPGFLHSATQRPRNEREGKPGRRRLG
jgi:hypothetical protein